MHQPKRRKNAAHGASRGKDWEDEQKPRRGERKLPAPRMGHTVWNTATVVENDALANHVGLTHSIPNVFRIVLNMILLQ